MQSPLRTPRPRGILTFGDVRVERPMGDLPELTAVEAFEAMRLFIEARWERGKRESEDLRMLLRCLSKETMAWPEGGPGYPEMWNEWVRAVGIVKGKLPVGNE